MKRLILSILLLLPLLASAATVRVRDLPVVTDLYNTNLVMVVTGSTNALASPQTVVSAAGAVTNGQSDVTLSAPTFIDAVTLNEGMISIIQQGSLQDSPGFSLNLPLVIQSQITSYGVGMINSEDYTLLWYNLEDGTNQVMAKLSNAAFECTTFKATNPTAVSFKAACTNGVLLLCPDGGSYILKVGNDGALSTITNSAGL